MAGYRHARPRQVGMDRQVEPRRPVLDPAQHQMLDRVKADRATREERLTVRRRGGRKRAIGCATSY